LKLNGCKKITDIGIISLSLSETLIMLNIAHCNKINDIGLIALKTCKMLTYVCITINANMTHSIIESLMKIVHKKKNDLNLLDEFI